MPRLKDLPDQVLSPIDRDADYGALQPLLRGRINVELIPGARAIQFCRNGRDVSGGGVT